LKDINFKISSTSLVHATQDTVTRITLHGRTYESTDEAIHQKVEPMDRNKTVSLATSQTPEDE
jgi:hypothetical protein